MLGRTKNAHKEILLDTFSVVKDTVLDEYLPGDALKILTACRIIKSLIGKFGCTIRKGLVSSCMSQLIKGRKPSQMTQYDGKKIFCCNPVNTS